MGDREYWKSRLHRCGELIGRFTKTLTHKKERRFSHKIEKDVLSRVKIPANSYEGLYKQLEDLDKVL